LSFCSISPCCLLTVVIWVLVSSTLALITARRVFIPCSTAFPVVSVVSVVSVNKY
jgi:hypothetical protein